MINVKEAITMMHYNTYNDREILLKENFIKKLTLVRSLENYSAKLDILLEQTSKIENISLCSTNCGKNTIGNFNLAKF